MQLCVQGTLCCKECGCGRQRWGSRQGASVAGSVMGWGESGHVCQKQWLWDCGGERGRTGSGLRDIGEGRDG